MKKTVLCICVLVSAACSTENKNEQALPVQTTLTKPKNETDKLTYISHLDSVETEQLSAVVKPEHQLNTLMARNDTVTLVLENRALFFPLGKYHTISALQSAYAVGYTHKISSYRKDANIIVDDMQNGPNAINFIRMEDDEESYEDKVFYIVSGRVIDGSLPLADATTVGMHKQAFLNTYFSSTPRLLMQGGKVIVLESALNGIKHYYTFDKQKLSSIEFASDYALD
ncbi:hypothetical protein LRS06_14805 [Hymenobacter sp. J193]|uniref:hypothetical protein n=1 Tax=Hymenobacter sp. J193 TaxID=2898429 RepID=UPI0021517BD9|nr:hypothetical protein [Hymenobacter sp. J193]MCR5889014.1 hypothetical protein [Hymenobacter sp. J193]